MLKAFKIQNQVHTLHLPVINILHAFLLSPVQPVGTKWSVLPGSSVLGIFQARILEWVAICYSRGVFLIEPRSPALTGRCEPPFHCVLVPYLLYLFLRPWTFEDLMVFIYSELDFAVHALGSPAAAAFPRAYLRDSPPLQGQGCSLP